MPVKKLKEFLVDHGVRHVTITHSPAFTAQEIAASAHVAGKEMAKTVMVKLDDTMAMVVLPALERIDLYRLAELTGVATAALATEDDFKDLFPDCELGAMPPFGNLYGMKVYASRTLSEDEDIAFNAGNHRELVRLAYVDFERLVNPDVLDLV